MENVNETGEIQDIALGVTLFMPLGDMMPKSALYFKDVGDGSRTAAKFTQKLRAYITSDYQEAQILEGAIETDPTWEQNLTALHDSTTWNLQRARCHPG
ncbi:hypothetical protein AZE42_09990 [Rhizopogon vesiculosus]|uniref:Uncharacterized protein n=1 Tax=Rhizopogon vesiculosus TaxID=180088 RepID=A0A1J8QC28_9AGAM|nr:hypothetical protein AZE42_09990 [Rhizopogon vesiculosus]